MKNKIKDSTRSVKAKPALVPLKGGSEAQLSKSHSHLQASPRKTFKKVYEQKHLVRNTKDQYSAVCDKVWQKSHQRLKIQLDGGMSKPAVPEAKLPLGDLITAKTAKLGKAIKRYAFGTPLRGYQGSKAVMVSDHVTSCDFLFFSAFNQFLTILVDTVKLQAFLLSFEKLINF